MSSTPITLPKAKLEQSLLRVILKAQGGVSLDFGSGWGRKLGCVLISKKGQGGRRANRPQQTRGLFSSASKNPGKKDKKKDAPTA